MAARPPREEPRREETRRPDPRAERNARNGRKGRWRDDPQSEVMELDIEDGVIGFGAYPPAFILTPCLLPPEIPIEDDDADLDLGPSARAEITEVMETPLDDDETALDLAGEPRIEDAPPARSRRRRDRGERGDPAWRSAAPAVEEVPVVEEERAVEETRVVGEVSVEEEKGASPFGDLPDTPEEAGEALPDEIAVAPRQGEELAPVAPTEPEETSLAPVPDVVLDTPQPPALPPLIVQEAPAAAEEVAQAPVEPEAKPKRRRAAPKRKAAEDTPAEDTPASAPGEEAPKPKKRATRARKTAEPAAEAPQTEGEAGEEAKPKRRRTTKRKAAEEAPVEAPQDPEE
ncbi:hypothetical protein [Pararhodospirillum photometricum]|uniref:hypothetical protein n=1 Tax=Pararhodospirillum photometricum TaxID=1084 RepID=UPI0005A2D0DE